MQTITISSKNITLPFEVYNTLKGKEVKFVKFQNGFVMESVERVQKKPNRTTIMAMEEATSGKGKVYNDIDEMFSDLEK